MVYRGGVDAVHFISGGHQLVGTIHLAASAEPCPALILLHGIPGSEKNYDIAYRLRELGWHTLIVQFRGSWGSDGDYDMLTQPDDALAALDFLVNTAAEWNVDAEHIAVLGFSLGNRAALVAAHHDTRISAVISVAGFSDFDEVTLSEVAYTNSVPFLRAATARSLSAQWMKLSGADNPVNRIAEIKQPMLIIHGTQDDTVPYWMAPALYEASARRAELVPIEDADHVFTDHRKQLVGTVTEWLERWRAS